MNNTQLIRIALLNHADLCRKQASRRGMAGPALAEARAAKRAEAKQAEELAFWLVTAGSAKNLPAPGSPITDRTPPLGDE